MTTIFRSGSKVVCQCNHVSTGGGNAKYFIARWHKASTSDLKLHGRPCVCSRGSSESVRSTKKVKCSTDGQVSVKPVPAEGALRPDL